MHKSIIRLDNPENPKIKELRNILTSLASGNVELNLLSLSGNSYQPIFIKE